MKVKLHKIRINSKFIFFIEVSSPPFLQVISGKYNGEHLQLEIMIDYDPLLF